METQLISGALLGSIVGDALGVPVEFIPRDRLTRQPVVGMRGFGTHNQPAGTWSDDSSMLLATVVSLTEKGVDYQDVMERFLGWLRNGEYTPNGLSFGVGVSTERSISRFEGGLTPLKCGGIEESDNGNGALMRVLPLVFVLRKKFGNDFNSLPEAYDIIHNYAKLTHGHPRNLMACGIYVSIANELLNRTERRLKNYKGHAISVGLKKARDYYQGMPTFQAESAYFARIFNTYFGMLPRKEIKNTGYVVDSLEASLWSFINGRNYADCVMKAVNLGGDTDTNAAICGGLAGIYYEFSSIPEEWLAQLQRKDWIEETLKAFAEKYAE
ncbi:ADP-ribosylglycohydrolase family protein [Enterococcus nangangensis]|uniref:ADP-ribosylglycohydrolase family protein n=1 Tax=Enterococcus nangangensis TaxID=2559926 RepID=UPI0010F53BEF|nr:ADP-ribosylglycohydrolase family protein [Enterococcus nangangensis]